MLHRTVKVSVCVYVHMCLQPDFSRVIFSNLLNGFFNCYKFPSTLPFIYFHDKKTDEQWGTFYIGKCICRTRIGSRGGS